MSERDIQIMYDEILPPTIGYSIEKPLIPPTNYNIYNEKSIPDIKVSITNNIEKIKGKKKEIDINIKKFFQALHEIINILNKKIEIVFNICKNTSYSFQGTYTTLKQNFINEVEQLFNIFKIKYDELIGKISYIYNLIYINEYFNFNYYKNELSLIVSAKELCILNYNNVKNYLTGNKSNLSINNDLLFTIYE